MANSALALSYATLILVDSKKELSENNFNALLRKVLQKIKAVNISLEPLLTLSPLRLFPRPSPERTLVPGSMFPVVLPLVPLPKQPLLQPNQLRNQSKSQLKKLPNLKKMLIWEDYSISELRES